MADDEYDQQREAEEAIRRVQAGANPTFEAFVLANTFTDRWTLRIRTALKNFNGRRLG